MKKYVFAVLILFAAFYASPLFAQQNSGAIGAILNHYAATSQFTTGAIPKADLDRIVQAGVRSPSAVNRQPWRFTVVQSLDLAKKIVPQAQDGNVLIVISAGGDGATNTREIIDCALAAESIYLAAQALGYASRIYTGPINGVNQNFKSNLGLPNNHNAVILVRVGKVTPGVDAISAASSRKAVDSLVFYK
ncbi:MAG: nitroreductase family protein [Treponema sp.]|jgi:nitroreductase|nr:nitroreductase family protein [Treponema sp.]